MRSMIRGGVNFTHKAWNTVGVDIIKTGRVCVRSFSPCYLFITAGRE